jgi:hypothetical protein
MRKKYQKHMLLTAVFVVLSLAGHLRSDFALTNVQVPLLRGDAVDYFSYAYNLVHHEAYSRARPGAVSVEPDALRPPLYSFFLSTLMRLFSEKAFFAGVMLVQAILSTLTLCLFWYCLRGALSFFWAFCALLLASISPQLVSMPGFLVSETLFLFCLMATTLFLACAIKVANTPKLIALLALAGLMLGLTSLTRYTTQYLFIFIAPWLWWNLSHHGRARYASVVVFLLSYMIVVGSWGVRNLDAVGQFSDKTLTVSTLHHGMYPNFMFDDVAESRGMPYRFDPRSKEIAQDFSSVLGEIRHRFSSEPVEHLRWYLLGKVPTFLSWFNVEAGVDVFIYGVVQSPYDERWMPKITYVLMKTLHPFLMMLGVIGSVVMALRGGGAARLFGVVVIYFLGLHIIGAPYPRYGYPIYPLLFAGGMYGMTRICIGFRALYAKCIGE